LRREHLGNIRGQYNGCGAKDLDYGRFCVNRIEADTVVGRALGSCFKGASQGMRGGLLAVAISRVRQALEA